MARIFTVLAVSALCALAAAQSDECPEKNGFFADTVQCDRYYECKNFTLTEKLCPDGLVFADQALGNEKCDYPFNVDCKDRPELQPPQPSSNCPRKNGYFPHPDPTVCNQFFFCSDGQFNAITCPDGLVFNLNTGTCTWPGEAKREGCSSAEVVKFECPQRGANDPVGITNPLYADPNDCQFFYVCVNNVDARRIGCTQGLVFNDETKKCDEPKNVPDCKDWYKGTEEDEEEEEVPEKPVKKNSRS